MSIPKKYDPKAIEGKWYKEWMDHGFFHSEPNPDKEPYTIVIPPPNVTGILHMGHMLNNTIQDVLIRKARMEGKEACWIPGTDHASIATEAKVVDRLRKKGITKADLTRDEFLNYAYEWKDEYGGIILKQLQKLGASCDWDREFFTMGEKNNVAVAKVFVSLYNKGYLYRDLKMVNWDPAAKTTLSNEEVIYKEVDSALYYVKYKIVDADDYVTIATTRPETILGDTAICVHPDDDRFKHLVGKKVIVPMVNREIPVIADEYVDREFGTGCLKITPAHDANDYEIGQKHNLEVIDILNDDATLSAAAQCYVGIDREEARRLVIDDLKDLNQLLKTESLQNKVGYSERNPDTVVEPKLSLQWFVDMQKIVGPALENVINDNIEFFPPKFKNLYRNWLENIKDWPISRQLWWGQQIPAWYYGDGGVTVAETKEEALLIAQKENPDLTLDDLRQDEDVVDTWFSSWLLPVTVFDGFENPESEEMKYYYPTTVLVTGWDIIFFWVARMIIAGYEWAGEMPFKKVYFTGMVRDLQRRKMSKSLGNSPDALKLIDDYGADGVRVGMLLSAAAGNDLLFDEKLCEQGRNFSNKIWNAFRLVDGWQVDDSLESSNKVAVDWFGSKYNAALAEIEDHFTKFRISDALMTTYKLVWNDFCSQYLEMVKPEFGKPIDKATYEITRDYFEKVLKILHPFMPFISEEIWHAFKNRAKEDYLIIASWPETGESDPSILEEADLALEIIRQIRNLRNDKQISPKTALALQIRTKSQGKFERFIPIVQKISNLSGIEMVSEKPTNAGGFVIKGDEFFIPFEEEVDVEKEKEKLQKELDYTQGFFNSVQKKLSNEKFVNNAPEQVVANERKKMADAESKIRALEEQLAAL
ncbi:MAG: valine--tRNA ligase [Bacteroidota bacterium]